jgi:hypothetical protein
MRPILLDKNNGVESIECKSGVCRTEKLLLLLGSARQCLLDLDGKNLGEHGVRTCGN